ncbi:MAG: CBS domain-containing protein, partial [Rhodobacterales bacterium]|nr:CBS domain-containing protein [Rhodobacterales bacterium]
LDHGNDMGLVCGGAMHLAGVVTKTDVVRMIGHCEGANCVAPITSAMKCEIHTTTPNAWLHDVWEMMQKRGLKNVPVVDKDGAALGILNARDVLKNLWKEVQHEEDLLFNYVMNVGYR